MKDDNQFNIVLYTICRWSMCDVIWIDLKQPTSYIFCVSVYVCEMCDEVLFSCEASH